MEWKITTLIENHEDREGCLCAEHGLSLLIEGRDFRMLLDTGQSGAFYKNAKQMGVSFEHLDCVLISHGHYDHAGGLLTFLKEEKKPVKLYVGEGFFSQKYHEKKEKGIRYIGIPFSKEDLAPYGVELCEITEDRKEIHPGVTLFRNFTHTEPFEAWNPGFLIKNEEGKYKEDHFTDEIAVGLDTDDGLVVLAGCSHPGIINMLHTIEKRSGKKIYGVIGGTHLVEADEHRLFKTMEEMKKMGIQLIGVSHCTGEENIRKISDYFGTDFVMNCTGNVIEI